MPLRLGEDAGSESTPYAHWRDVPAGKVQFPIFCAAHSGGPKRVAVVTKDGFLVTGVGGVSWVRPGDDSVLAPCERCVGALANRALSVAAVRSLRKAGTDRILLDEVLA